jgi:hypothetical protein
MFETKDYKNDWQGNPGVYFYRFVRPEGSRHGYFTVVQE